MTACGRRCAPPRSRACGAWGPVVAVLLVLGAASIAAAQNGPKVPFVPYPEARDRFNDAARRHGDVAVKRLAIERRIEIAKERLAPYVAAVAALGSQNLPVGDRRLADAQAALHAEEDKLLRPLLAERDELDVRELKLREEATSAATPALTRGFELVDRLSVRPVQRDEILNELIEIMKKLDDLENMPLPPVSPFKPEPLDEGNLLAIAARIRYLEADAKRHQGLVADLTLRINDKRTEESRLVNLTQRGVTLDRVLDSLKTVQSRLEELDRTRTTAQKRAADIQQEVLRLQKRKDELQSKMLPEGSKRTPLGQGLR